MLPENSYRACARWVPRCRPEVGPRSRAPLELDVGESAGARRCPVQCECVGSPRRRESVAFAPVPGGSSGPLALLRVCHDHLSDLLWVEWKKGAVALVVAFVNEGMEHTTAVSFAGFYPACSLSLMAMWSTRLWAALAVEALRADPRIFKWHSFL